MLRTISPAARLAFLFAFVGFAWILGSDLLVTQLVPADITLVQTVQHVKGLVFILLCSLGLYLLSRTYYQQHRATVAGQHELLNRYQALARASKEGIVDHCLLTDKAYLNEQMRTYLQEHESVIEHFTYKFRRRIHPDDRPLIIKNFQDTVDAGADFWQGDFRVQLQDGTYHDVTNRGSIIRDEKGAPVRFIAVLQDVTELRNMRTAFYEQQIRHRQLLGQHMIKAQEAERNRWSEELHDNVGQQLTVVKLYLDMLGSAFSPELLAKAGEMTVQSLNDIRRLSSSIKPPVFSSSTLAQALESLIANIVRVHPLEYRLQLDNLPEEALNDEQKLMVYRVVQEQLNNIIKYAGASFVEIVIYACQSNVHLEIKDNGQGFDMGKVVTGIGLRNIRSRLQVYSGSLSIKSAPGEGCTLSAAFSLE